MFEMIKVGVRKNFTVLAADCLPDGEKVSG
jgi:hypothetical protein